MVPMGTSESRPPKYVAMRDRQTKEEAGQNGLDKLVGCETIWHIY